MSTTNVLTQPVKKVIIDSPSALDEWARSLRIFGVNGESKTYVFNLCEFSFYENVNISTQVDYYNTARGNKTGSFLMSLTFLTLIISYFISGGTFSDLTVTQILSCIGITILGSMVGRIIGLINAHWNLIRLARDMQKRLNGMYTIKQMKIT